MPPPNFRRLIDILGEAMSLPPSERDIFLENKCRGDDALLREAHSLLAEAHATSFDAVTAKLGARVERAAADLKSLPKQIGPYTILGLLGEGGMGVVYRAEQTSPIRREVALKVARGGLRGESGRARFEAERQALAVMDHPNIARIYDAGELDGTPYFAMELVHGDPITVFCDGRRSSVDERVALFVKVCRAVQHAHMKGVVHRDLKPSNILVSPVDGVAEPRVIDFGIAKAIEATADAETMHTAFGSVIGTLEYMSPEQAGGQSVDTRSDVYSLGVILYQLVTGSLPFESAALRAAGPAEAQRLIRDTDPPTPARRFTATHSREEIARARGTEARALEKRLEGDLGWIILKAIEKDPARRYQSASDFAADLDRLRRNQPVEAGPPSRRYRASRFVRRHRTGVIAASLIFAALVSGITLATVGFVRAKNAQHRAEIEAARAKKSRDFLTKMLAQSRPDKEGPDVTMMTVVDSAAAYMAHDTSFADDPLARADIIHALAETYRTHDNFERAIPMFQEALAIKRATVGDNDRTILVTLNKLSECQATSGDLKAAIVTQKDVVATAERVLGKETDNYSAYLMNLGNMYADSGDLTTAEPLLRESLAIQKRVNDPLHDENLPFSINNLATVLVDLGKCDDAIPLHQESIAMRRRLFGMPSAEVAVAFGNYARALDCAGRSPDARVYADSAVTMCATEFGPDHVRTATARVRLAEAMLHTGDAASAEPLLRAAIATFQGVNPRFWRVGDAQARLGEVLLVLNRDGEGIAEMETGYEIYTETTAPDAPRAKEIAGIAADYYEKNSERAPADLWRQRAAGGSGEKRAPNP